MKAVQGVNRLNNASRNGNKICGGTIKVIKNQQWQKSKPQM